MGHRCAALASSSGDVSMSRPKMHRHEKGQALHQAELRCSLAAGCSVSGSRAVLEGMEEQPRAGLRSNSRGTRLKRAAASTSAPARAALLQTVGGAAERKAALQRIPGAMFWHAFTGFINVLSLVHSTSVHVAWSCTCLAHFERTQVPSLYQLLLLAPPHHQASWLKNVRIATLSVLHHTPLSMMWI